ncbi:MAG: hypothetical protein V7L20_04245 [Nostoc sp.]|uniref:hypothetical protein n=1 Tax=Nostoc sp. TaxID=1180 RepID=UPI002FF4E536
MPLITDEASASEHLDNLIQNLVKDITNNDDIPAEYIDFIKSSENSKYKAIRSSIHL